MEYTNIIGYRFTNLSNLDYIKSQLLTHCLRRELKGTILLSLEGINLFLSGTHDAIDSINPFLLKLNIDPIEFKKSTSIKPPFHRMLVKIKSEIIPLDAPSISPSQTPAPTLSPHHFKQWLEEKRDFIILDARNEYEVRLGKFKNAVHLNLQHFRSFKEAVKQFPSEYKNKTIVTYCTGGIRCEKAAPYMIAEGFEHVYQLEGGILKYFEQCGGTFFEGECFMFDKRVAVDSNLQETQTLQCLHCRQPVTVGDQTSPHFTQGKFCPHCYVSL